MTFLEAQNNVYRLMRDTSKTKFDVTHIKQWINHGEQRYCALTEYSEKKDTSILTVIGTREYAVPSDFKSLIAIFYNGKKLSRTELEDTIYETDNNGEPSSYYFRDNYIGFEPIPSAVGTITLIYYSIGGDMVNDGDNPIIPEEHQMLPVFYACYLASIEADDNRLKTFYESFAIGVGQAKTENVIKDFTTWPQVGED